MAMINNLSSPVTEKPRAPNRYTLVVGTFLPMFVGGIVISSFGVFFKPVSAQLGWTRVETSGAFCWL